MVKALAKILQKMHLDANIPIKGVLCFAFRPANTCLSMRLHGRKQWKNIQKSWKSTFSIAQEAYVRLMKLNVESLSIAEQQTVFFVFLHEPYMSLSYAWGKRYFFNDFGMFFYRFWPCKHMCKHTFAGRNTKQCSVVETTLLNHLSFTDFF